ncbi:hypothetical protein K1W54_29840 [Micromonospora sp. CPCC 205371]|nr:hypothetical protein [Micromonospora sp. CPCC 205371]
MTESVGRCGERATDMFSGMPPLVCALPAGHAGWHRDDGGAEWSPRVEERIVAGLTPEQEIRARAALAAHPPFGMKSRLDVIDEIAAYIRDGSRKDQEVNLGDRRRLVQVAPNGCDDCSVEPGETHRYTNCPGNRRAIERLCGVPNLAQPAGGIIDMDGTLAMLRDQEAAQQPLSRAAEPSEVEELAIELAEERTLHQQTIRELETMREVARSNKRHVKYLTEECERLTAEVARVRADERCRVAEEIAEAIETHHAPGDLTAIQSARIARHHASAPAERVQDAPTDTAGTPEHQRPAGAPISREAIHAEIAARVAPEVAEAAKYAADVAFGFREARPDHPEPQEGRTDG